MKNELTIFENPEFGQVRTITENGKVLFCAKDIAIALGYKDATNAIKQHCKGVVKRHLPTEGGRQEINFIPEGDVYRLITHSKLPGAEEFEHWVFDEVLPSIRKTGAYTNPKADNKPMTAYQQMMADTRQRNARIQSARILTQLAGKYKGTTYEQVLNAHATRELTGEFLLPLPQLERKTYSATEIGKMVGVTANRVGLMTNAYKLKTDEYGEWFKDKSRYSSKEVPSFRYYDNIVPELRKLLEAE